MSACLVCGKEMESFQGTQLLQKCPSCDFTAAYHSKTGELIAAWWSYEKDIAARRMYVKIAEGTLLVASEEKV